MYKNEDIFSPSDELQGEPEFELSIGGVYTTLTSVKFELVFMRR